MAYFKYIHTDQWFQKHILMTELGQKCFLKHIFIMSLSPHVLLDLCIAGCLFCIFVLYMGFFNVAIKCIFISHRQKK